ncbi:NAD(P)-binding protein [Halenospora varia]|nr:NAD(P)-binding protein [Halenospora varia]
MSFFLAFLNRQFISYPPKPTFTFTSKTIIITGGSSGLGLEAARYFINLGASQVIIACRNIQKGEEAIKNIQASTKCPPSGLQVWKLDLSSYASVIEFSKRAKKELPRLDVLVANAGLGTMKFKMTEDNEEIITTNVVSMALLSFLLHPKLSETARNFNTETHLTVTGSELYEVAKFKEAKAPTGELFEWLADEKRANMFDRYNVSKLLALFVVKEMAALSPLKGSGVVVNIVAPGFCQSGLHREHDKGILALVIKILARPTEVGARTLVYGAGAGSETHGGYLPDSKLRETRGLTSGDAGKELQARAWSELKVKLEGIQKGVTDLS